MIISIKAKANKTANDTSKWFLLAPSMLQTALFIIGTRLRSIIAEKIAAIEIIGVKLRANCKMSCQFDQPKAL